MWFFLLEFLKYVFFDGKFQKLSKMENKLCGFCILEKNYVVFVFGTNDTPNNFLITSQSGWSIHQSTLQISIYSRTSHHIFL